MFPEIGVPENMKTNVTPYLHLGDVKGRRVNLLRDAAGETHVVDEIIPEPTFWVRTTVADWLVLHPYGDDTLPAEIRQRVFGIEGPYTVAIERSTGAIRLATLHEEDDNLVLSLHTATPDHPCIPPPWRAKLDELRGEKRPYRCHICPLALENFIVREFGWADLRLNVVFVFPFRSGNLEVTGDQHRVVLRDWKVTT